MPDLSRERRDRSRQSLDQRVAFRIAVQGVNDFGEPESTFTEWTGWGRRDDADIDTLYQAEVSGIREIGEVRLITRYDDSDRRRPGEHVHRGRRCLPDHPRGRGGETPVHAPRRGANDMRFPWSREKAAGVAGRYHVEHRVHRRAHCRHPRGGRGRCRGRRERHRGRGDRERPVGQGHGFCVRVARYGGDPGTHPAGARTHRP